MKRADLAALLKQGRQLVIKHGLAKNPSEWSDWSERVGIALRGEGKPGETEEIVQEARDWLERLSSHTNRDVWGSIEESYPIESDGDPEDRVDDVLARMERWLA